MALNPREQITDTSPQSLNKLNNNFMTIWKTLFGGLDFSDTNSELKKKIQTQQIPVQGEGNFDKNFPLYIRFFVPNNTKSITSTSFNMICERYRMDSSVAMDGGGRVGVDINMSLASSNTAVASVSSPTVGVSSVSSQTVGVTSVSGGGTTSSSGGGLSTYVDYWGNWNPGDPSNPNNDVVATYAPYFLYSKTNGTGDNAGDFPISGYPPYGSASSGIDNMPHIFAAVYSDKRGRYWLDLAEVQHKHVIPSHTHGIPKHSHDISLSPHSHTIALEPHTHKIELAPHTHEATASVDLPDHTHNLNEGIKVSTQEALNVEVKLNGTKIADLDSMSGSIKNNIDAKDLIKIGEWNILECTTTSLARITIYGIIELIKQY
jgi:hypothetical protein